MGARSRRPPSPSATAQSKALAGPVFRLYLRTEPGTTLGTWLGRMPSQPPDARTGCRRRRSLGACPQPELGYGRGLHLRNRPETTFRASRNHASDRAARHEYRVPTKPRHPRRPPTRTSVRAGFAPSERTRNNAPSTTNRVVLEATRHDNRVRSEQQHGRVLAARPRRRVRFAAGAIALLTAVIVAVALVGGFSGGTPKQDLAAQDQAVALSNRLDGCSRAARGGAAPTRTGTSGRGPCPSRERGDDTECFPRERPSRATREDLR